MVAPATVIASPIWSNDIERRKQTTTRPSVTRTFLFLSRPSFLKKSSSTVSFAGSTHIGAGAITAKNMAKRPCTL